MRPPFPAVIDSSLMSSFRSCPQKCKLEYFEHWKPAEQSVHLHAGAAYAAGLEAARHAFFVEGKSAEEAEAAGIHRCLVAYGDFNCPPESAKSAERTAGALEFYFDQYPLEDEQAKPIILPSGKHGIEFSFAEPIDVRHPETDEPILYVGRLDQIVEMNGMMLGEDDKTTSSLGATWSRQWDLRSQFTGYTWGAKACGIKLDGFLIRGVSILKTKYDTQQAITYRPQWMIDRWYAQLHLDVLRMVEMWRVGYFDYNLDHACAEYGGCVFRQVCQMQDPTQLLETHFERRRWDPVTRTETKL